MEVVVKKLLIVNFFILIFVINALAQSQSGTLLIVILDTSPSVRIYWPEIQSSAQELIRNTPEQVAVGVVGIDAEAQKSDVFTPARRAEALDFVQGLKIGGKLTDLARGTDAALALLQQANPSRCVIIYLTDGKLVVPKTFRNQGTFFDLLRREFTPRSNVEVVVVNVKGERAAQREPMPSNVRILSLQSSGELREAIARHLTPTVKEKLETVIVATPEQPEEEPMSAAGWLKYGLPGLILMLATVIGAMAWKRGRNRRAVATGGIVVLDQPPADVMREEDLLPSQAPAEIVAPPVALVTATDPANRREGARRRILRAGEQAIVGVYKFAELALPGLRQARTLQLRFDGKVIRAFRLRPQLGEGLDDVKVNQASAPPDFCLGDKDVLKVGDFILHFVITREDEVPESWLKTDMPPHPRSHMHLTTSGRRPAPRKVGDRYYDNGSERQ